MKHGICILSVIPLRKEPSDISEMVSQLLFGELFSITQTYRNWIQIIMDFDGYEGWIDKKQCFMLSSEEYHQIVLKPQYLSSELLKNIKEVNCNNTTIVPIGATLPGIELGKFSISEMNFVFDGNVILPEHISDRKQILDYAQLFLNVPYLWGGRTPMGIDCSGFTQLVYKLAGIKILRDTIQQAELAETVHFISDAQIGDLAFFDNDEGKIIHTGIILDNQKIIHASGKVRIDTIDHYGIFNEDYSAYTHQLRIIKSYF